MMLIGENSRIVVERAKQRIAEIEPTLPRESRLKSSTTRRNDRTHAQKPWSRTSSRAVSWSFFVLLFMLGLVPGRAGRGVGDSALGAVCHQPDALVRHHSQLMSLGAIDFG